MTENDLRIELQCYQESFNKKCDIDNLSIIEWADFITLRDEMKVMENTIELKTAPILEVFEDIITDEMRDKYSKDE